VASLVEAKLTDVERRSPDLFVDTACRELGDDLQAIWLYGSPARGEGEIGESDVDVLVITARGRGGGDGGSGGRPAGGGEGAP
jgi:predicted nucleotidyltransferase